MNKKEYLTPNIKTLSVDDEGILAAFTSVKEGSYDSSTGFTPSTGIDIDETEKKDPTNASGWDANWAD